MSYTYFAEHYDSLTEDVDYSARAEHFLELLKRHGHSPRVTLDLACGTGSFLIELLKRGIDAFGADMSCEMLTLAQTKTSSEGFSPILICCKMQEMELYSDIDTCVCTLDSINHITDKNELVKAFSNVARYLSADGIFVFDANTVYKHKEILSDNCYIIENEDVFCAWQNEYDPSTNEVLITLDFFEAQGDMYSRTYEQFSERAYTDEEMKEMLTEAGLEIEAVYDDMSFSPPETDSQRVVYVVKHSDKINDK